jgi:hypothetical protein
MDTSSSLMLNSPAGASRSSQMRKDTCQCICIVSRDKAKHPPLPAGLSTLQHRIGLQCSSGPCCQWREAPFRHSGWGAEREQVVAGWRPGAKRGGLWRIFILSGVRTAVGHAPTTLHPTGLLQAGPPNFWNLPLWGLSMIVSGLVWLSLVYST